VRRPDLTRLAFSLFVAGTILAPGMACVPPPPPCPPPEDEAGCTGHRWIAITNPNAPCPIDSLNIWTEQKLFKGPLGGPPPSLARYCVYEWTGARVNPGGTQCLPYGANGPGDDEINQLQTVIGVGAELGEDCIDTTPMSFDGDFASVNRKSLTYRAGGVDVLPTSAMNPAWPIAARIAAADTSPDSLSSGIAVGQSRHGDTVAHIARDLSCPQGEQAICAGHLTTALALPRFDLANPLSVDLVQGGFFGTEGDLATSIESIVLKWREDVEKAMGEPRLVINLSVGWQNAGDRNNCSPPQLNMNPELLAPPARAVLDVMRYATCHGALIMAAAGNDTGGTTPQAGLVCPARWEELSVLDFKTCAEWVGKSFEGIWKERWGQFPIRAMDGQHPYNRVVYAVGGLDYGNAPLVPTRPRARPRITALGLLGAAWDASPNGGVTPNSNGQPVAAPPPITGTSISTAVASAIAAAAWAYAPNLTAPDIVDKVYFPGVALQQNGTNIQADVGTCIGATSCDVKQLSLCRTLGVPCTNDAAPIGMQGQALPNPALGVPLIATLTTEFASATATNAVFPDSFPIPDSRAPNVAAAPWTFPQPNWPTCPSCVINVNNPNTLVLYAKPGVDMSDMSVVLVDQMGVIRSARVATQVQRNSRLKITITSQSGFDATKTRRVWLSGNSTSSTGTAISVVQQIAMTGL
jgi:hypothetical protein